ncbi:hypothetical protein D3C78_1398280 [compost metagenome]
MRLHRDAVLSCFATGELNHFADCLVDVQRFLQWWRFPDQFTNAADHDSRSIAIVDDTAERLPNLFHVWRLGAQPPQRSLGVGHRRGDRLLDFVSNRRRELPHRGDAVRMC